ncbi:MAG: hypothetical protein FWF79_09400 [Defluviitaleaceae bacterium]|nr:hypothetical protein [Defluviitaleaceae bacterium]
MSYQLNRVHLLICIFAALVLTAGFVWHIFFSMPYSLFTMALWVSSAIVLFWCIGHFIRSFLIKEVFVPLEEEYNFDDDPEYQAIMGITPAEQIEFDAPEGVMFDDPMAADPLLDYEDSGFPEPLSVNE